MSTGKKWQDEEVFALIEMLQSHEWLHNITLPEYRDRQLKLATMRNIAVRIGNCSVGDVCKKIKNLRTQYAHEKKKLFSEKCNGEEMYGDRISKWKFFDALKFFDSSATHDAQVNIDCKPILQSMLPHTAAEIFSEMDVPDHDESSEDFNENPSSILPHSMASNMCTPSTSADDTQSPTATPRFVGSSLKRKRFHNEEEDAIMYEILTCLRKLEHRFPTLDDNDDDCSMLGKFIAFELRRMDATKRQSKKQELCNVLFS